jgi:hypothetical protein
MRLRLTLLRLRLLRSKLYKLWAVQIYGDNSYETLIREGPVILVTSIIGAWYGTCPNINCSFWLPPLIPLSPLIR